MPNAIFTAAIRAALTNTVNFGTDTFWAMLTTSAYAPNKDTHVFRSSVTNEITGSGYTAGGKVITCVVQAVDAANDDVELTFGPVDWASLTATGVRQIVVYKRRGGAAAADEIIYCQDFGADTNLTAGTLTVEATTVRFTNPT